MMRFRARNCPSTRPHRRPGACARRRALPADFGCWPPSFPSQPRPTTADARSTCPSLAFASARRWPGRWSNGARKIKLSICDCRRNRARRQAMFRASWRWLKVTSQTGVGNTCHDRPGQRSKQERSAWSWTSWSRWSRGGLPCSPNKRSASAGFICVRRHAAGGKKSFELAYHMLFGGIVYSLTLRTDEEHYDAYRADFEELCAAARFSQPTKGVGPLPAGFWLQREYGFALWLPADFQPAFAARGKILLSATRAAVNPAGAAAEMLVVASGGAPLGSGCASRSNPAGACRRGRQGPRRTLPDRAPGQSAGLGNGRPHRARRSDGCGFLRQVSGPGSQLRVAGNLPQRPIREKCRAVAARGRQLSRSGGQRAGRFVVAAPEHASR